MLDPLYTRGLCLEDGDQRLLWLHADLLGVERSLVAEFRRWSEQTLGIPGRQVMVSATHTHSGPATVHLTGCGRFESAYVDWLLLRLQEAALQALSNREPCALAAAEGRLELGVDRTQSARRTRIPASALAWQRRDGTFKAVMLNYAMHPVGLDGRLISADYPGQAALALSAALPGMPTALVSIGACGNINPPAVGVPYDDLRQWGRWLAEAVAHRIQDAAAEVPSSAGAGLKVASQIVQVPLECWSPRQIDEYAASCLADAEGSAAFGAGYPSAIEHWRASMTRRAAARCPDHEEIELFGIRVGETVLLGINAEVFSHFTDTVRTAQRPDGLCDHVRQRLGRLFSGCRGL